MSITTESYLDAPVTIAVLPARGRFVGWFGLMVSVAERNADSNWKLIL